MKEKVKLPDQNWDADFVEYFSNRKSKLKRDFAVLKSLGLLALPKEARILELFCGRGECQELLRNNGYASVFGLDMSLRLLKEADKRCCVQACNSLKLCYKADSFDVLFVNEGLHHLRNMEEMKQFFCEAKYVLKQDGMFGFFEPADTVFRIIATAAVFSPLSNLWGRTRALKNILESEKNEFEFWLKNTPAIFDFLKKEGFRLEKRCKTFIHMISVFSLDKK